jgi:hypothetical protein
MAEGVRIQVVVPVALADALRSRAAAEGRTVSSLAGFILEAGFRQLPPLAAPSPRLDGET